MGNSANGCGLRALDTPRESGGTAYVNMLITSPTVPADAGMVGGSIIFFFLPRMVAINILAFSNVVTTGVQIAPHTTPLEAESTRISARESKQGSL